MNMNLMQKLVIAGTVALSTLAIVFLTLSYFIINSVGNLNDQNTRLTFTGTAFVNFVPTIASFSFAVEEKNSSVAVASKEVSMKTKVIYEYLKNELNIKNKDIKTDSYSVQPEYENISYFDTIENRKKYKRNFVGYRVAHRTSVSFEDFENAEKALSFVSSNGATNVSSFNFTIREDEREKYQQQAKHDAIEKAKTEAKSIAKVLGVSLGDIVNYSGDPTYPIYNNKSNFARRASVSLTAESADAGSIGLERGEGKINSFVSITYKLKQ